MLSFARICHLLCFICCFEPVSLPRCFPHEIKALLSSLLAGSGVSLVRKGGGGASGVRQPGPAADRRPMPRYFGTSGQRSGRQLLTHTHRDTQLLATSKCLRVTKYFTFAHLKLPETCPPAGVRLDDTSRPTMLGGCVS